MKAIKAELMAPAGSYESLKAAIDAGADSIYFGVEHLNMRARAANSFALKDLGKIADICRKHNVKSYLTLNSIIYDEDVKMMRKICDEAKKAKISAIIAHDLSVIQYARSIGLEIHMSTQANISNLDAVKFYSMFADCVVLARELNLKQIKSICNAVKKQNIRGPSGKLIQIEIFIHGALCVSISGKCYMSLAQYNHSANRGDCLQTCRRSYKVTDLETGDELKVDNKFVMSPKDLCTISFIDQILKSGVTVLKIEGRGRHPEYVYTVTKAYREAIDSCYNKTFTKEKAKKWIERLETVFNRGFWHGGYYLGKKLGEWSNAYGSKATKEKVFIGFVNNYYEKVNTAQLTINTGKIKIGDEIAFIGPTTGILQFKLEHLRVDGKPAKEAKKNDDVTVPVSRRVRKNDKFYIIKDRTQLQ